MTSSEFLTPGLMGGKGVFMGRVPAKYRVVGIGWLCGGLIVLVLGAVVGGLLTASHGWHAGSAAQYLAGLIAGVVGGMAIMVLLVPAWTTKRVIVGGLVGVAVAALVVGLGIVKPRHAVSAEYEGENVLWSKGLPSAWDRSKSAAGRDAVSVRVLNSRRAVLQRGSDIAVVNLKDGKTVRTFRYGDPDGVGVIRTVDGFELNDDGRLMFYSADGKPLRKNRIQLEESRQEHVVARAKGITVVAERKHEAYTLKAVFDKGDSRWKRTSYRRATGDILPIQLVAAADLRRIQEGRVQEQDRGRSMPYDSLVWGRGQRDE